MRNSVLVELNNKLLIRPIEYQKLLSRRGAKLIALGSQFICAEIRAELMGHI